MAGALFRAGHQKRIVGQCRADANEDGIHAAAEPSATHARDSSELIQRDSPDAVAMQPSSVWAHLAMTQGRPVR